MASRPSSLGQCEASPGIDSGEAFFCADIRQGIHELEFGKGGTRKRRGREGKCRCIPIYRPRARVFLKAVQKWPDSLWYLTDGRNPLPRKDLRPIPDRIDTPPRPPPVRHAYIVISTPGFFHPLYPHVFSPVFPHSAPPHPGVSHWSLEVKSWRVPILAPVVMVPAVLTDPVRRA